MSQEDIPDIVRIELEFRRSDVVTDQLTQMTNVTYRMIKAIDGEDDEEPELQADYHLQMSPNLINMGENALRLVAESGLRVFAEDSILDGVKAGPRDET